MSWAGQLGAGVPDPQGPEGREGTGSLDSYFLEREARPKILDFSSLKKERDGGQESLVVLFEAGEAVSRKQAEF